MGRKRRVRARYLTLSVRRANREWIGSRVALRATRLHQPQCSTSENAMQATKVLITTDGEGRIQGMPTLPPNARLEAIFLVVDQKQPQPTKRRPSPRIPGLGTIHGDLIAPVVDAEDWDALR